MKRLLVILSICCALSSITLAAHANPNSIKLTVNN